MGRYIITVSGVDCKSEIISKVFCLDNRRKETEMACIALYNERCGNTSNRPRNIVVNILDVDDAANHFKVRKDDVDNVNRIIHEARDEEKRRKHEFHKIWNTMTQEEKDTWVAEAED